MYKMKIIVVSLLFLSFTMYSCLSDKEETYDKEWRAYQEGVYDGIRDLKDKDGQSVYYAITSQSGLGQVYCRPSDFITKRMDGDFSQKEPNVYGTSATRALPQKPIYITDSVEVRYQGWLYALDGTLTIFDPGTEADKNNVPIAGFSLGSVVDGFRTALMDMTIDEERIVCIPYNMGYGVNAYSSIPGFTTLFFDVKLLKIYSQP